MTTPYDYLIGQNLGQRVAAETINPGETAYSWNYGNTNPEYRNIAQRIQVGPNGNPYFRDGQTAYDLSLGEDGAVTGLSPREWQNGGVLSSFEDNLKGKLGLFLATALTAGGASAYYGGGDAAWAALTGGGTAGAGAAGASGGVAPLGEMAALDASTAGSFGAGTAASGAGAGAAAGTAGAGLTTAGALGAVGNALNSPWAPAVASTLANAAIQGRTANALQDNYDRESAIRQEYLDRLSGTYTNPEGYLNSPEYQAMQRVIHEQLLRKDAAGGNLANNTQRQKLMQDHALASLEQYRSGLRSAAGLGNPNTSNLTQAAGMYESIVNPLLAQWGRQNTPNTTGTVSVGQDGRMVINWG